MPMRLIFVAILLALSPATASAQQGGGEPEFTAAAVKAHVDFLADDLLEGREPGTRGYDVAARYVATRFEAMGLKPGGANGSWYQQIPFARFSLDPAKPATMTIGSSLLVNGKHVLIAPSASTEGTQKLSGPAAFVGYGYDADYAGLDVTGKFVAVLYARPEDADGSGDRAAIAAAHGAKGLLYLFSATDLQRIGWDAAASYVMGSEVNWLSPQGEAGGEGGGLAITAYLDPEATRVLLAGSAMNADKLQASLALPGARPRGFALTQPISIARTSKVHSFTSANVVGLLPGSDPKLANEYVVLSAHLDHLGTNAALAGDRIYNGAMDNAAGTAAMLEAARGFAESGKRPRRSILFVALTGEELGLLGSEYLARYPVVGDGTVVADVNLDMPLLLYDFQDVVAFGAEHSTLGPIVDRAAGRMGVTLSPDPMPEENLFVRSDHYSFVKAGVPSVFLVTGFKNGGKEAFAKFLKETYHQVSDQADQPIDWQAGAKFARINYLIAREIADGEQRPLWYAGDRYGDRFAPDAPRAEQPAETKAE